MPRPKLHSDKEILTAARAVLVREGAVNFTLSDVAKAVGMSRPALIQRFHDKTTLHRHVMEAMTQEVRDYFASIRCERGLVPLWTLLRELISGMDEATGNEAYLLVFWGDIIDPLLRSLANERNELVRQAIEASLPEADGDAAERSGLIQAVIQGAYMQWMVSREGSLTDFMTYRAKLMLQTLYPGHEFPH
ncbi:TetR/AcrR family transcriptional regulator [Sphingopyxis kveilinensis]|uniref:TetR/AcrR family transcriptional regulator n=1 Tax=Sphingopyxis kveilinensis TaxID=3114367 RepID=UPI0030D60C80